MIEINPPRILAVHNYSVFLAGSIEQGKAIEWQKNIMEQFNESICFYNPRRVDFDLDQKQDISNEYFFQQVDWEMRYLKEAKIVVFYFQSGTLSPISIGELYYCAALGKKCIVCCEEGFWRKGNIDIVCYEHNIQQVNSLDQIVSRIKLEYYRQLK